MRVAIWRSTCPFIVVVALALLGGTAVQAAPCPAQFNLPPSTVCDLTGEVCRSGSEVIDGKTFCLMQGRLGDVAIEMDDINNDLPTLGNPASVADANVQEGLGACAIPCNDPNLPPVAGATFIDWNDLAFHAVNNPLGIVNVTSLAKFADGKPIGSVENHRIVDFTANKDWTIFASGSCVTDGSTLPKEDFTQSYLGNNNSYLYFAQERRTNSGNSVYYWMLNAEPPGLVTGGACGANTRGELQFKLTPGDLQVIAAFPSSSDPAGGKVFLRRYQGAVKSNVPADDAVFDAGWVEVVGSIKNLALTIGPSRGEEADDAKPVWGGITAQGEVVAQGNPTTLFYETAELAEWAVDFVPLFGGGGICGRRLFLTGISRSATGQIDSLTDPADLKDLVGPKLYSFGSVETSASLTPTCDPEESTDYTFDFEASATDADGNELPSSDLSCTWTCTSDDCEDPDLAYDDASQCTGTGTIARADGAANAGPCDVSCSVEVEQLGTQCSDSSETSTTAVAPILVSIAASPNAQSCANESGIGDGITYGATASGGDLDYTYVWNVTGPSAACGDTASCTIDFADGDFCASSSLDVTIQDGSICPDEQSETETVQKVTTISGSNN